MKPVTVINGIDLTAHMGLIARVAKRYRRMLGGVLEWEDLIQWGWLGMRRAAEKFDPSKGFAFSTYSQWWITNYIQRCIMNERRTVRVPIHTQNSARLNGERFPLDEHSLDRAVNTGDGDSVTFLDCMPADVDLEQDAAEKEGKDIIENAMFFLSEKDQRLIRQRYWGERTLNEIGVEQGVSRERIRQREKAAIERLGKFIGEP